MRMQSSDANCGPTALSNALYAMGINRSASECEVLCKTNATNGTDVINLVAAIDNIPRCNPVVIANREPNFALFALGDALRRGRSAILCVSGYGRGSQDNEHFVAAIGLLGGRVLIADSSSNELVESWTSKKLAKRWAPDYWGVLL